MVLHCFSVFKICYWAAFHVSLGIMAFECTCIFVTSSCLEIWDLVWLICDNTIEVKFCLFICNNISSILYILKQGMDFHTC